MVTLAAILSVAVPGGLAYGAGGIALKYVKLGYNNIKKSILNKLFGDDEKRTSEMPEAPSLESLLKGNPVMESQNPDRVSMPLNKFDNSYGAVPVTSTSTLQPNQNVQQDNNPYKSPVMKPATSK